jgi:hypothetical protein
MLSCLGLLHELLLVKAILTEALGVDDLSFQFHKFLFRGIYGSLEPLKFFRLSLQAAAAILQIVFVPRNRHLHVLHNTERNIYVNNEIRLMMCFFMLTNHLESIQL